MPTFLTALVALSVIASHVAAPADLTARVTFNGDGVPGATVTATLGDRRAVTTTDETGQFRFADLADGTWTIRVDMRGFVAATRDVTVPLAQPLAPFALTLQSYAEAVAGSPKPAAAAKTDAEPTAPDTAATAPEPVDIINGSVVNGATTPFALSPAFGNGRPRGRSLYSGGLSAVVGNSAWNASPYSFVSGGPPAPSYGNVQFGATLGGPLKIPWLVTKGPNMVVAYQHNVSHTVTTQVADMPTLAERAGDFSALGVEVLDPLTGLPFPGNVIPAKLDDPITDIPMAATVNYFQINRAEYFVPVSVRMPGTELARARSSGASHVDINMIGEIKDEHGVTYRNVRDLVRVPISKDAPATNRLIQYETGFTMLPGSYVIKLLARNDSTGTIGTFQSSFTVPNLEREASHVRISSVVLTNQRVAAADAVFTVKQKVAAEVANPLVDDGQKLIPAVGGVVRAARPLYVYLEAYERDGSAVRPLVAYVTFYRDGSKAFETPSVGVDSWNPKTKTLRIRFTIPGGTVVAGTYDCQVTVLDPSDARAAFWRASVVFIR